MGSHWNKLLNRLQFLRFFLSTTNVIEFRLEIIKKAQIQLSSEVFRACYLLSLLLPSPQPTAVLVLVGVCSV